MSVTVHLPPPLRPFAGGARQVTVESTAESTVGDILRAMAIDYPGVVDRTLTETGSQRQHVNLFVDTENTRHAQGLETPVPPGSSLWIIPAVSGG